MRNVTGKVIDEQQLVLYLIYGSRYKCKVSIAINVQKRSTFRKVLRAKEWWLLQNIVLSTDLVLIKKNPASSSEKKNNRAMAREAAEKLHCQDVRIKP